MLVDEVPHVGGHVDQEPDVLGLRAGGLLDQPLPHQGPAQPERVQQGIQRQALLGPGDADPPGAAVGGLAGAARVEQRGHAVPQRAVHLLPGARVVVLQHAPVRRLLLAQHRQEPVGQLRQVVEQDAGRPVQDAQRVGVDQRPDASCPRLRNGHRPGAERRACACGRMHRGPSPTRLPGCAPTPSGLGGVRRVRCLCGPRHPNRPASKNDIPSGRSPESCGGLFRADRRERLGADRRGSLRRTAKIPAWRTAGNVSGRTADPLPDRPLRSLRGQTAGPLRAGHRKRFQTAEVPPSGPPGFPQGGPPGPPQHRPLGPSGRTPPGPRQADH
ncbi:hypothetical protein SVIOM74S_06882 [Streptomyces violarus]